MADIYAKAQLVIVAAAGQNANDGLLGVNCPTSIEEQAVDALKAHWKPSMGAAWISKGPAWVSVGPVQILLASKRSDFHSARHSKWASRAWTFQEFYFAKRRLTFTDEGISLICNQANLMHAAARNLEGWFPRVCYDGYLANTDDSITQMMLILRNYTGRQLTFDSDALGAVVGALHTFRSQGLGQIWGVPCQICTATEIGDAPAATPKLGIFWYHPTPCKRRVSFPSWSPIAWTGQVDWYFGITLDTSSIHMRFDVQTDRRVSFAEICTREDYAGAPRLLEITAMTVTLRLVKISWYMPNDGSDVCALLASDIESSNSLKDEKEYRGPTDRSPSAADFHDHATSQGTTDDQFQTNVCVALPFDDRDDLLLSGPYWDSTPPEREVHDLLLGIRLNPTVREDDQHTPRHPLLLLVKSCGTLFERIGILQLKPASRGSKTCVRAVLNDEHVVLLERAFGQYLMRRGDSAQSLRTTFREDIDEFQRHELDEPFERCWRQHTVERTIILG